VRRYYYYGEIWIPLIEIAAWPSQVKWHLHQEHGVMLGTSLGLVHKDRGPFVGVAGLPEMHLGMRCCYTLGLGNMLAVVEGYDPEEVFLDMRFRASRFARSLQVLTFVVLTVVH
jgi:hypothetical protein